MYLLYRYWTFTCLFYTGKVFVHCFGSLFDNFVYKLLHKLKVDYLCRS